MLACLNFNSVVQNLTGLIAAISENKLFMALAFSWFGWCALLDNIVIDPTSCVVPFMFLKCFDLDCFFLFFPMAL